MCDVWKCCSHLVTVRQQAENENQSTGSHRVEKQTHWTTRVCHRINKRWSHPPLNVLLQDIISGCDRLLSPRMTRRSAESPVFLSVLTSCSLPRRPGALKSSHFSLLGKGLLKRTGVGGRHDETAGAARTSRSPHDS